MGLVDYFHLRSVGGSGKLLVASYGECRVHELISRGERHQLSFAPSSHGERTRRVLMLSTYGYWTRSLLLIQLQIRPRRS